VFSVTHEGARAVKTKQLAAVVVCTAIVLAAYVAWDRATSSFNPNPASTTLKTSSSCSASSPGCPAFGIVSANLTVVDLSDIVSQELTLNISATGSSPVGRIVVFFSGIMVENYSVDLGPHSSIVRSLAIPTTIEVVADESYKVIVGSALAGSEGTEPIVFWSAVDVTAS
jgi:hypothetical protein